MPNHEQTHCVVWNLDAYGLVVRGLDSRSKGLGFDAQLIMCRSISKLLIPYCLCPHAIDGPPTSDGYLSDRYCVLVAQAVCILA